MDARVELERARAELERTRAELAALAAGLERDGPRAGSWGSSWRCAGARWSWWEKGGAQTGKPDQKGEGDTRQGDV